MLEDGDREDRKRNIDKEEERRHKLSRTEKDLGRTTRSNRSGSSVKGIREMSYYINDYRYCKYSEFGS